MESYFLNVTLSKYNLLEWSSTDEKQIETDRHRVELFNNSLLSTCDQSDSCFHSALTLLSQGNETVSETSFRLENTFKLFEAFPKTMDLDHYLVFSGVKKMSVFPVFWMKSHISCPQLECFPNDSALEKTNQNLGQRFSTIDYHVLNKEQDLSMRLLTNLNILCRLLDLDSNCGKKESEAKIRSMSPIQQDKFFGEHISQLSSINIATYILALHSQTYDSFMYDIANIPFNKKQSNRMIKKFKNIFIPVPSKYYEDFKIDPPVTGTLPMTKGYSPMALFNSEGHLNYDFIIVFHSFDKLRPWFKSEVQRHLNPDMTKVVDKFFFNLEKIDFDIKSEPISKGAFTASRFYPENTAPLKAVIDFVHDNIHGDGNDAKGS